MRNLPHKVTGDDLTADEFNDIPEEEENLITSSSQALSAGDLYQIAKAVAQYCAVGDFYADSGAANAYVLTAISPLQAPPQYMDGMRVRFRISHTNTGPATVNVNTLGIKAIVKEDGISPLGAGDLPIGEHGELIFHADIDSFELYSHKYQDQSFGLGDHMWTDNTGVRAGWIWVNNSTLTTIGNATSGATIRANADCINLFNLYWTFNATDCPIYTSTGVPTTRGVSAAADWAANTRMAIPSKFRRVFAAHDTTDTLRIGQTEGTKTHSLTSAENGTHTHVVTDPEHTHGYSDPGHAHAYGDSAVWGSGSASAYGGQNNGSFTTDSKTTGIVLSNAFTGVTINNSGSGTAHNNMQPTIYTNLYIKL